MPNTLVFPGGRFDPIADRSWLQAQTKIFVTDGDLKFSSSISPGAGGEILLETSTHVKKLQELLSKWENIPNRPPMFEEMRKEIYKSKSEKIARKITENFDFLEFPVELSFRMCAFREMFEETGILCARHVLSKREFITSPADFAADQTLQNCFQFSG